MSTPLPVEVAESVLYSSTYTAIGPQVAEFVTAHGILVMFASSAPSELHGFSALHEAEVATSGPQAGDVLEIGGSRIPVLGVGSVVHDNLISLGHIDLKANGRRTPDMPGDCCVPVGSLRTPPVGATFRILRPATAGASAEDPR